MAASHWLGDPPTDDEHLAAWALSRIAAVAAEDVHADAVVDIVHAAREVQADLGGRFGGREAGEPASGQAEERRRFQLHGISPRRLREEDSDEPWATLFDPTRLLRGIATVEDVRRSRTWIELDLTPHAAFAAPADTWLPPEACGLTVRMDIATGFLLSATVADEQGPLATARVSELTVLDTPPPPTDAGRVLARMARTLVEPVRLTADVRIEADTHTDLTTAPTPSARSWTLSCGTETLAMTGDYEPDRTSPAAARLAELLTPARIVSHLAHAEATSPASITATVRPLRSFPLSAWAPDENLTCHFTVDPTTGVLLHAEATDGDHTLFRHIVTSLRP